MSDSSGICCCGIRLQTGAKTVAAILLTIDCIYFISIIYELIQNLILINNPPEITNLLSPTVPPTNGSAGLQALVIGVFVLVMGFLIVDVAMNILLAYGASKADYRKCRIWKRWTVFVVGLGAVSLVFGSFRRTISLMTGIATVFELLFDFYALTLVSILIKDIKDHPTEYLQPLNPE